MTNNALKLAIGLLLFCSTAAIGQFMTERFVPIGQSPGISGEYSTIGNITEVDSGDRTVTVRGEDGERTYKITDATHIWIDRSDWKLTNLDGTYRDCAVGQRVEIMHRRGDESVADWIKVEAREKR